MHEITITELADESGLSVSHIGQLINRGVLPKGRKEGKLRYLPYERSIMIIGIHTKNKHWPKTFKKKTWADLL